MYVTVFTERLKDRARLGLFTPNGYVACAYCVMSHGLYELPTGLRTVPVSELMGPAKRMEGYEDDDDIGICLCEKCSHLIMVRADVARQMNLISDFKNANPDFGMCGEWASIEQTGGMCANAKFVFAAAAPNGGRREQNYNAPRFAMFGADDGTFCMSVGCGAHDDEKANDEAFCLIRAGSHDVALAALNFLWAEEKGLRELDGLAE